MKATPQEQWRWIVGYEGRYEVSDQGRVRTWVPWNGRPIPRLRQLVPTGVVGYLTVILASADGTKQTCTVHSLVAESFIGVRPPGAVIRHLDGDHRNNQPTNLRYGTQVENARDMIRHGHHRPSLQAECKHGHPYEPTNLYIDCRGRRNCLICMRDSHRRYKSRKRRERREGSV